MSGTKISEKKPNQSIAVSIGEPAGIGPDIIVSAWARRAQLALPHFTVFGDITLLRERAELMKLSIKLSRVGDHKQAMACGDSLPVIALQSPMKCSAGKPQQSNAAAVIEAIETGAAQVIAGNFSALVTCPINKKALYDAGFEFPGHTEMLAEIALSRGAPQSMPVMMLAGPQLRSVPVTIHVALDKVKPLLTTELIVRTGQIVVDDLRHKFGINNPVLAFAGLNPHAGEEGAMGMEEIEIITPAIKILQTRGIQTLGPLPADTMFHPRARAQYDVAICMYHDQALIPAKTLGFDEAVNVTLGLPFIRTSPDHGTAYALAGSGEAKADSFIAALEMAALMAQQAGQKL